MEGGCPICQKSLLEDKEEEKKIELDRPMTAEEEERAYAEKL